MAFQLIVDSDTEFSNISAEEEEEKLEGLNLRSEADGAPVRNESNQMINNNANAGSDAGYRHRHQDYQTIRIPENIRDEGFQKTEMGWQCSCSLIIALAFCSSVVALAYCVPNFASLNGEITQIETKVVNTRVDIRDVNATVEHLNKQLGNFTSLEQRVDEFNSTLDDMEKRYDTFLTKVESTLEALENTSADFNQSLALMKLRVDEFNSSMNDVEKQYISSLAKVKNTLELLENASREFNQSFAVENDKIKLQSERVDVLQQENSDLKTIIDMNTLAIKGLNAAVLDLEKRCDPNGSTKGEMHVVLLLICVVAAEVCRREAS